jgi:hypothetical protein
MSLIFSYAMLHELMKVRFKMTNAEKFTAVSKTTFGDFLFDADNGGEWIADAVETQETLADWDDSKKYWNECAGRIEGEVAGFKFLGWSKVQSKKGDARRSVTVIDFGDFRMVLDCNPAHLNDC